MEIITKFNEWARIDKTLLVVENSIVFFHVELFDKFEFF